MDDFGQSLDVGKTLEQKKEVVRMSEESSKPVEQKPEAKPKVVKKKAAKSAAKKAKKPKKDDDFDFDNDEAGVGLYVFWAVVVIAALLIAMWIFTDWQFCIQF